MYYKNQDFIQKFGKRLKAEREAKNISQEQLALLTEISQSQIARTELGNVNTSISHAALYANTLGIDVRVLFDFSLISE
ncbi:MAG: XRE family transcriptional regulator [Pedobacter sp.]|nr:MAG: XRE family transcriptional regulator [Pedobacter sp.]